MFRFGALGEFRPFRKRVTAVDISKPVTLPPASIPVAKNKHLELFVTLWPSFPHFDQFRNDYTRLNGIRLNSAMAARYNLEDEMAIVNAPGVPLLGGGDVRSLPRVPLWFDIKGKQLRVVEPIVKPDGLELIINHPIQVHTPTPVLFKAGEDVALLKEVRNGTHLIFDGGPRYVVHDGESFHIRHPSLQVGGDTFTEAERARIAQVYKGGFRNYFLSYVQSQRDVDAFREMVGDVPIIAKIEDKKGLEWVANDFRKQDNLSLMAARGDLFVEVDRPHDIMAAMRLIIQKDPEASAGSRMLLSMVNKSVPDMADLGDLAWMYEIGYRRMMLCDELCLKDALLSRAVNAFDAFRESYTGKR